MLSKKKFILAVYSKLHLKKNNCYTRLKRNKQNSHIHTGIFCKLIKSMIQSLN